MWNLIVAMLTNPPTPSANSNRFNLSRLLSALSGKRLRDSQVSLSRDSRSLLTSSHPVNVYVYIHTFIAGTFSREKSKKRGEDSGTLQATILRLYRVSVFESPV